MEGGCPEKARVHPEWTRDLAGQPTLQLRPLGVPTWPDKLVGEVMRLLLEAYYEPQFSDRSYGFRPGRGCHTALRKVAETWTGTTWFIEGDISDCFGSLDHEIMVRILAEKIHDNRFLRLIKQMLQAGYLEDWEWNATYSGAPQGGVVSPVLSNIYLHRLDIFVETVLIPQYTRGVHRASNVEYKRIASAIERARKRGDRTQVRDLRKRQRNLPSQDPRDPGYRRLRYARYADLCRARHKSALGYLLNWSNAGQRPASVMGKRALSVRDQRERRPPKWGTPVN